MHRWLFIKVYRVFVDPERLLVLDLALQRLAQPDDGELADGEAEQDAAHHEHIVLYEDPDGGDTAPCVDSG